MDVGQGSENVQQSAGEDEGQTVEIKIRTLDAQSYTLRVDKNTSVPALKEQIASVVGVPVENQRLICRGKVLKDDQLLAAYNVEDGHTLHLVSRQPPPLSTTPSLGQDQATAPSAPSDVVVVSPRNRAGHVSHSLLMGTINIPDTGEGGMPDLNRIISAVLSSVGIGNNMAGAAGTGGPVTIGVLPTRAQQPAGSDAQTRSEGVDSRLPAGSVAGEQGGLPRDGEARLQIDALYGVPPNGIFMGAGTAIPAAAFRAVQQPAVVPDALTTMSQYLDRLEQSFPILGRSHIIQGPGASEGAIPMEENRAPDQPSEPLSGIATNDAAPGSSSGPSIPASHPVIGSNRPVAGVSAPSPPISRRLPTPPALGAIVRRVQELVSGPAGTAFSRLASQLENEPNLHDAVSREEMQTTALRDGNMMQQLGALLLELGRATLTLRLGQSPAESVVNAGPAVFISPSGPNPMMVQSLPLQAGMTLGALPPGAAQTVGGVVGPVLGPRSINIHIHTSDLRLPPPSPSSTPPLPQQPPSRTVIGLSPGAPALTARPRAERSDAMDSENALTVRQIIERAEAANGVQPGNSESNLQSASNDAVQGAIMTFNENGAVRIVPVRTRSNAVPLAAHPRTLNDGGAGAAVLQPFLARFHQQLGSMEHARSPSAPPVGPTEGSVNSAGTTSAEGGGPSVPPSAVQTEMRVPLWPASLSQALGGGSAQAVVSISPLDLQLASGGNIGTNGGTSGQNVQPGDRRTGDVGVDGQSAATEGLVPGVDVGYIVESLGPLLHQLAAAFRQSHAHDQPSSEQPPVSQPSTGAGEMSVEVRMDTVEDPQQTNGQSLPEVACDTGTIHAEHSEPVPDIKLDDKMDINDAHENTPSLQDDHGSTSNASDPLEKTPEENHHQEGLSDDRQIQREDKRESPPIGLGVGGLQLRPPRSRRRIHGQPRDVQVSDGGTTAHTGNGVSALRDSQQPSAPGAGQNILQGLLSMMDRPGNGPEDNAMEQSLGDFSQGLLPLLGAIGNGESTRGGEGGMELGDIIGQLVSRADDGNPGRGAFPTGMLRGMVSQLVQSPVMENLVNQVMTGVNNQGTQDGETQPGNHREDNQEVLDFSGIVQQMLPVVSQMFGGRPTTSASQQVSNSSNLRNSNEEGPALESPGQTNDSGRWREALSDEEVTVWSDTISADVEQQQSMGPQRPFSDVYARGSPVAKRQKTELEGRAEKLDNGWRA